MDWPEKVNTYKPILSFGNSGSEFGGWCHKKPTHFGSSILSQTHLGVFLRVPLVWLFFEGKLKGKPIISGSPEKETPLLSASNAVSERIAQIGKPPTSGGSTAPPEHALLPVQEKTRLAQCAVQPALSSAKTGSGNCKVDGAGKGVPD